MTEVVEPKVVAFCGAGISMPAGIPGMATLTDAIRRNGGLSPQDQVAFDRVLVTCLQMGAMVGASARNLEHLASFISVMEMSHPDFVFHTTDSGDKIRPKDALKLLLQGMAQVVNRPRTSYDPCSASRILNLADNTDLTVITTNYDLNFEFSALHAKRPLLLGSHLQAAASKDTRSGQSLFTNQLSRRPSGSFRLIKLHGSVNWVGKPSDFAIEHRLTRKTRHLLVGSDEFSRRTRPEDYWELEPLPGHAERVIVPPSVLKGRDFPSVADEWKAAAHALSEAEYVIFAGYSFPESDSFLRYFLASSLANNPALERIVVIDPDPRVSLGRARDLLAAPHHQEIYTGLPLTVSLAMKVDVLKEPLAALSTQESSQYLEQRRYASSITNPTKM